MQMSLFQLEPLPSEDPPPTVRDYIFPSDHEWGVPTLDPALQVEVTPTQFTKWGTVGRTHQLTGCIHFYTDDYKFSALWKNPMPVVKSGCSAIVEPNYSQNPDMPAVKVLDRIYNKRWLARFWQTYGIRVLVDLNVEREFFDIALLGVPIGWMAYANRVTKGDLNHLFEAYELARTRAGREVLYVVYGGGASAQKICMEKGWHWYPEDMWKRIKRHG